MHKSRKKVFHFTFCCSIPLVPLACLISRLIGADFQNRENPLTQLGILFAVNQIFFVLVSGLVLYVGCNYPTVAVAILMLIIEMLFSVCLWVENRMDYSTL